MELQVNTRKENNVDDGSQSITTRYDETLEFNDKKVECTKDTATASHILSNAISLRSQGDSDDLSIKRNVLTSDLILSTAMCQNGLQADNNAYHPEVAFNLKEAIGTQSKERLNADSSFSSTFSNSENEKEFVMLPYKRQKFHDAQVLTSYDSRDSMSVDSLSFPSDKIEKQDFFVSNKINYSPLNVFSTQSNFGSCDIQEESCLDYLENSDKPLTTPIESFRNTTDCDSDSPIVPPTSLRKRKSVFLEKDYQRELVSLSRLAWGTPGRNALEKKEDENMALENLRTCGVEAIMKFESPFGSQTKHLNKRRTIAAVLPESPLPHLDKRTLSSTYKPSIERDRVLAKNLGGWDVLLTLKGQLACIDRELLESLILETCCTEPRLVSKIADYCIKSTDLHLFTPRGLK